ncbi:MAG: hypothetical protein ACJAVN_001798 [Roseivirga sp.]|jgi:hypothetical protein
MPTNLFIPYGMIHVIIISMLFSAFRTKAQSPPLVKKERNTTYKNAYLSARYSAEKQGNQVVQSPDGMVSAAYFDGITQVEGKHLKVFMKHPTSAINLHWT